MGKQLKKLKALARDGEVKFMDLGLEFHVPEAIAYVIVIPTDWQLDMVDPPLFPELKIGGAE